MAQQPGSKMELKETYDRNRFLQLLQQWTRAIERKEDLEVNVDGESHVIPAQAIEQGKFRVEYEIEDGEHEFELTLKWR